MRTRDYRRLRQVELIRFAIQTFGRPHWRTRLAEAIGRPRVDAGRWLMEDWNGNIQHLVECWAEQQGFRSRIAERMVPERMHLLLLNQILEKAYERRAALERKEPMSNSILPFNEAELDQVFAAMGFELLPGA